MEKLTLKEIEKIAEENWEGCHGCDENDKNFWIHGFRTGFMNAYEDAYEKGLKKGVEYKSFFS